MVLSNLPAKVIAKAFRAGFHLTTQRAFPWPVGSRLRVVRYRHFMAAASLGKWPRAFTARRYRALMLSIAFVVQI